MVREEKRRAQKYEKNLDPEAIKKRLEAQKADMVEQQKGVFATQAQLERKVKRICEGEGVSTIEIGQYLMYAKKLQKIAKKFTGATVAAEFQNMVDLWSSRGLTGYILVDIAELFGVTPTALSPNIGLVTELCVGAYHHSLLSIRSPPFGRTLSADRFYTCLFPVPLHTRWDEIAMYVSISPGAGALVRMGVYRSNGNLYPSELVLDAGDVDVSAVGIRSLPINLELTPGQYFIAFVSNMAGVRTNGDTYFVSPLRDPAGATMTTRYIGWFRLDAFGPLPDPWFPVPHGLEAYLYTVGLRLAEIL